MKNLLGKKYLERFSLVTVLMLALALGGVFVSGCKNSRSPQKPEPPTPQPKIGDPAIDFSLPDLEGNMVSLADFQGQTVLLNFWATWCRYCVEEMDLLEETHIHNERVAVVAINVQEKNEVIRRFREDKGFTLPILLDESGELFHKYGFSGYPTSVIINRQGIITSIWIGVMNEERMEQLLKTGL